MGEHPTTNAQQPTPSEDGQEIAWELQDGPAIQRKYDLEERLLAFATAIIDLSEKLPSTRAANHVAGQILRSGTSPYPNHGEAESAESHDDFIHKLKLCLKELRETRRWARLIQRMGWAPDHPSLLFVLGESEELIRIFHRSIQTARRNALEQSSPASASRGGPVRPLDVQR